MNTKGKKTEEPFVMVPHKIIKALSAPELQVWCAVKLNSAHYTTTLATIASLLKKDKATISRTAKRLVERGYLIQQTCPNLPQEFRYVINKNK
jgi:DNA-binding MarR family transcriptional regulator